MVEKNGKGINPQKSDLQGVRRFKPVSFCRSHFPGRLQVKRGGYLRVRKHFGPKVLDAAAHVELGFEKPRTNLSAASNMKPRNGGIATCLW